MRHTRIEPRDVARTMPVYTFTALSEEGVPRSGEGAAESEHALRADLALRGLLVERVRQKRPALRLGRKAVRVEDVLLFNQEFLALIRAGLTVPDAIHLASDRPDSPALGRILDRILQDVRGGALLSGACAHYPEVFDRLYLAALRAGERTGDLAGVLARQQVYLRHRAATRKRISHALTYPAFLLVTLLVIVSVLFLFVMPRFVDMYADLGSELPAPTRLLLGFVERLHIVVPSTLAAAAAAFVWWRKWTASEAGRQRLHRLLDRLPYVGELMRTTATAQLSRALSTLLAGGTPLVEALQTATGAVFHQAYANKLGEVTRAVTEGASLADALRGAGLVPAMAVRMIEVGEASGALEAMFAEIAAFYEELLGARLARMMALLEPLLILVMGVLIGGIIIVMYLPVFHVADVIQ